MAIQYLKKSPKTSSTDDSKTREIVEGILKDIEKTLLKAMSLYTRLRYQKQKRKIQFFLGSYQKDMIKIYQLYRWRPNLRWIKTIL